MLFVGCFLEPTAAITILVPILVPICQKLGIDLFTSVCDGAHLMIGLLHPPMGMVAVCAGAVASCRWKRTTVAILPWRCLCWQSAIITYFRSWSCGSQNGF